MVDQVLLEWADEVVCMDSVQKSFLENLLLKWKMSKPVHNIEVEDDYDYRDPNLVEIMTTVFSFLYPVDNTVR